MLALLLSCASTLPSLAAPDPDPSAPSALVLEATGSFATPGSQAPGELQLTEGQLVEVHARGTQLHLDPDGWGLTHPRYLIASEGERAWVSGAALAVEQGVQDTGWSGQLISRRQLGEVTLWSALKVGEERSEPTDSWGRAVTEGWLVLERGDEVERLPLVDSNGWGSAHYVERVIYRDLTGDGVDELIIEVLETVTEYGAAGRRLLILDVTAEPFAPLLELPIDDPHMMGLDVQDRWGFVELDLEAKQLRKVLIERSDCDEAPGRCVRRTVQAWSWAEGWVHVTEPQEEPWVVTLGDGGLYAAPLDEDAELSGPAAPGAPRRTLCVSRVRGFPGSGMMISLYLAPCEGEGPAGWANAAELGFDDPLLTEIFVESDAEEEVHFLRVRWEN